MKVLNAVPTGYKSGKGSGKRSRDKALLPAYNILTETGRLDGVEVKSVEREGYQQRVLLFKGLNIGRFAGWVRTDSNKEARAVTRMDTKTGAVSLFIIKA